MEAGARGALQSRLSAKGIDAPWSPPFILKGDLRGVSRIFPIVVHQHREFWELKVIKKRAKLRKEGRVGRRD